MKSREHRIRHVPSLAGPWRYERCERCAGFDSSIPTECPGRPMTTDEKRGISQGTLDYAGERWFDPIFDL